jgi:plasmid stability protein
MQRGTRIKLDLRVRAASRNRSMEEEARQILRAALLESPLPVNDLTARIRARFASLGDVELNGPVREPVRAPPGFDGDSKAAPAARPKRGGFARTFRECVGAGVAASDVDPQAMLDSSTTRNDKARTRRALF